MLAQQFEQPENAPPVDRIVVLRGLSWSDYQRMLEVRGEKSVPRFAFLKGELEIMTSSRPHESIKSRIGRLVEVWCLESGVDFSPCGSWTLEKKAAECGVEADECYVLGPVLGDQDRPDLAIEVVWTSGGVKKLEIYRNLGVKEVWFWRRGRISVHVLNGDHYLDATASSLLPGLDLAQLTSFIDRPSASQAMREYRAALAEVKTDAEAR